MHELVIFGLTINIISRILGVIVAFDMYQKSRELRHLIQDMGWFFLLISAFTPFGATLTQDLFIVDIFLLINVICLNIGVYLLITSLTMYFTPYTRNAFLGFLGLIVTAPLAAFLIFDFEIATNLSVIFQFFIIVIFVMVVFANRKEIRNILHYSYRLVTLLLLFVIGYLLVYILIIVSVPDYSYGLYRSTNSLAIVAYYASVIMVTLLGLLVFLHLEQGIFLREKNVLTDQYSHTIGNILQVIVGAGSTIDALSNSSDVHANTQLILEKSQEAGELINKIREM